MYGALALTEGDLKYGGFNWRVAGVCASVYVAAVARHLEKFWNGEDCDPVTKVPHLANALASLAVLVDAITQGNLKDDRPPKQDLNPLFAECTETIKHLQKLFPKGPGRHTEETTRRNAKPIKGWALQWSDGKYLGLSDKFIAESIENARIFETKGLAQAHWAGSHCEVAAVAVDL